MEYKLDEAAGKFEQYSFDLLMQVIRLRVIIGFD